MGRLGRFAWLGCLVVWGCSPATGDGGSGDPGSHPDAGGGADGAAREAGADSGFPPAETENTPQQCMDGEDNNGNGQIDCLDPGCSQIAHCMQVPDAGTTVDGSVEGCEVSAQGERKTAPVDIVWTIDTSGSMENDVQQVQMNMDDFAQFMRMKNVDFRVVMISDRNFVQPSSVFQNDDRFKFVQREGGVPSKQLFTATLDQWDKYKDFLRPGSTKNFAVVTDDNDLVPWMDFKSQLQDRLQSLGSSNEFKFHAIASPPGQACYPLLGCCRMGSFEPATATGTQYWNLAQDTGGTTNTICTDDWSSVFDDLAKAVATVTQLPCTFQVPEPPSGQTFDKAGVTVEFAPANGMARLFPRADGQSACGDSAAWHYDDFDDPAEIHLCPAACDAVKSTTGEINVQLGCEVVPVK